MKITREQLKTIVGEVLQEEEDYQAYFKAMLKKHGVSSPAQFKSDEEKKAFFDKIDAAWKGKSEKTESVHEARDAKGNEFPELDDVKAAVKKMIQNDDVEKLLKNKVISYLQKEKRFDGAGNTNSMRLFDKVINDLLKH